MPLPSLGTVHALLFAAGFTGFVIASGGWVAFLLSYRFTGIGLILFGFGLAFHGPLSLTTIDWLPLAGFWRGLL